MTPTEAKEKMALEISIYRKKKLGVVCEYCSYRLIPQQLAMETDIRPLAFGDAGEYTRHCQTESTLGTIIGARTERHDVHRELLKAAIVAEVMES